jgi:hypothetical protein
MKRDLYTLVLSNIPTCRFPTQAVFGQRTGSHLDNCAGDTLCVAYVLRLLPISIGDSISSTFWVVTP